MWCVEGDNSSMLCEDSLRSMINYRILASLRELTSLWLE